MFPASMVQAAICRRLQSVAGYAMLSRSVAPIKIDIICLMSIPSKYARMAFKTGYSLKMGGFL
jgi:hypothetical protein